MKISGTDKIPKDERIREAVEDAAGLWLARMDARALTSEEVNDLRVWVGQSEYHRQYLYRLARNWDDMAVLGKLAVLFPVAEELPQSAVKANVTQPPWLAWLKNWTRWELPQWRNAGKRQAYGISMIAIVTMLAIWQAGLQQRSTIGTFRFQTAVGETRQQVLPDGSTIILNTNSHVYVAYTENRRTTTLLQGEVSFEVAKDTDRPFQVLAGGGIVQAVGTEFSVHLTASNEVDVIVVEGRVAVMRETRTQLAERTSDFDKLPPLRLDAGEGVRYGNGVDSINRMKFDEKTLDKKLAWKRGVLIFKGETLEQAIEQISRYTTNNIVIDDPSLASMQVGGRYKTNDIDTLIQSLAEVMEIDLHYLPGGKVILKKSNG